MFGYIYSVLPFVWNKKYFLKITFSSPRAKWQDTQARKHTTLRIDTVNYRVREIDVQQFMTLYREAGLGTVSDPILQSY